MQLKSITAIILIVLAACTATIAADPSTLANGARSNDSIEGGMRLARLQYEQTNPLLQEMFPRNLTNSGSASLERSTSGSSFGGLVVPATGDRPQTLAESGRLPPHSDQVEISPLAERLAAQQLFLWTDNAARQRELAKLRRINPEWDLMSRSFAVWGLANRCLRHGELKAKYLELIDRIIDDTMKTEREQGGYHFLMPYARKRAFLAKPPRSLFVDGEIALMLAARRIVEEKESYRRPLTDRVREMLLRMESGPVLCAESYPDECWMFCNTVALAAIRLSDRLDGTDHSAFFQKWLATAKQKLVDRRTGLLISSFTRDGRTINGPRGSSIWMAAHCLQLIDEPFAADQYRRAKKELSATALGLGYAREWPASAHRPADVDSGAVIAGLEASASSSGLALVAAHAFDDRQYFQALHSALDLFAAPHLHQGRLQYGASNHMGDSVIFYAAVVGPLWEEARKKAPAAAKR